MFVLLRLLVRPIGYLSFVLSLLALSAAARILGDRNELGFFSERLARMLWRYPELTRRGIITAWLIWAAAFAISVSPLDPLATRWDEVALALVALLVLVRQHVGGHRAGR